MANGFVDRQPVKLGDKTVAFTWADVPDSMKDLRFMKPPADSGVPAEFLDRWWQVTPFSPEPWTVLKPKTPKPLPSGFEDIFGPKPHPSQFHGSGHSQKFREAVVTWESHLATYVGPGMPSNADPQKVEAANGEAVKFEMGEPAYYENKHGFQVRFPDSEDPNFQAPFDAFVNTGTGQVIVSYQNRLTNQGIVIPEEKLHPLAPPVLRNEQRKLAEKAGAAAATVP